ncbi:MAG: amino acid ABC transporter permease [Lentisphaeria bacterium]
MENLSGIVVQLLFGLWTSLEIFIFTLLFSLPLGLFVALGRMSHRGGFRALFRVYISIMRGTPLMLQLLVIYFGPYYLMGISISSGYRFSAVIIAFSLNYAAYFAEIFRAGIESISVGQHEAAAVLGYSKGQTFLKIILPQVVKRIIPPITNEVITLIKDTSLAFAIAVPEMFTTAKQIVTAQKTLIPFAVAGVFYYVFNLIVAVGMEKIERKLSYYR